MEVSVRASRGAIFFLPGSGRWKAPRLLRKRLPSRGGAGTGVLVESRGRREYPALRSKSRRRYGRGVREAQMRRGTFTHADTAAADGEKKVLCSGRPTRAVQCHRSTIIAASGGRVEAPPASGVVIGRGLLVSCLRRCLQRRKCGIERAVAVRGARVPSSRGEGRCSVTGAAKAGANSELLRNAVLRVRGNRRLVGVSVRRKCSCRSWSAVA